MTDSQAHDSLDEVVGEVVDEIDREPAPPEGEDRFDVMADEIAAVLRTTHEAAQRLQVDAEKQAADRVSAASAQAGALVADAQTTAAATREAAEAEAKAKAAELEEQSQAKLREAKEMLDEATALLAQARERDRTMRKDTDEYVRTTKLELQTEAVRNRDATAEILTRSKQLLGDAEREMAKNVEHATASVSALSAIQEAMKVVENDQAQFEGLEVPASTDAPGDAETGTNGSDDDGKVIDLTDGATANSTNGTNGDTEAAENPSTGDAAPGDELDEAIRTATLKTSEGLPWPPSGEDD